MEGDTENLPAYAQVWALGFMYAVESWPEDWLPPRDQDAAQMLDAALENIVALTGERCGRACGVHVQRRRPAG